MFEFYARCDYFYVKGHPSSLTNEGGKEANIAQEVKVTQLNMMLSRKKVNESVQLYSR